MPALTLGSYPSSPPTGVAARRPFFFLSTRDGFLLSGWAFYCLIRVSGINLPETDEIEPPSGLTYPKTQVVWAGQEPCYCLPQKTRSRGRRVSIWVCVLPYLRSSEASGGPMLKTNQPDRRIPNVSAGSAGDGARNPVKAGCLDSDQGVMDHDGCHGVPWLAPGLRRPCVERSGYGLAPISPTCKTSMSSGGYTKIDKRA